MTSLRTALMKIVSTTLAASLLVLLLPAKATAAPGAFDLSSPANGAWCAAACTFTWQSATSATSYDLYIDGALKKAAIADSSSSSYTLAASEAIIDGWHTWSIVARDSGGNTTQSTSTWSVHVDGTPPASFTTISPLADAWVSSSPASFSWNASSDAQSGLDHYEIWINGVATSKITTSTSALVDLPSTQYLNASFASCAGWTLGYNWACAMDGTTSVLSWLYGCCDSSRTGNAAMKATVDLSNAGQAAMWIRYQSYSGSDASYHGRFSDDGGTTWSDVLNFDRGDYSSSWWTKGADLPLAGTSNATVGLSASDSSWTNWLSISNITVQGIAGGHYSWYIVAVDAAGNRTASETRQLGYDLPPAPFDLASPPDGTVTVNATPTFSWNASSDSGSGLSKYQLWFSGQSGDTVLMDNIDPSATSATPTSPITGGTWYMVAVDKSGNTRVSREKWTIAVDTYPPDAFHLKYPMDNSLVTMPTPWFGWDEVRDSVTYKLFIDGVVARDGSANCGQDSASTSGCYTTPSLPLSAGAHTWFVRATDEVGNYRDSAETRSFTVDTSAATGSFNLLSPANNAVVTTGMPTLVWQGAMDASSDQYWVSIDGVWVENPLMASSYTLTTSLTPGTHSWSVRATIRTNGTPSGTITASNAPWSFTVPSCTPVAENCSNGIDDDCDGLVDCADPDCASVCASGSEVGPGPRPELPRDGGIDAPLEAGQDDSETAATDTGTNRDAVTVTDTGTSVSPEPQHDAAPPVTVADAAIADAIPDLPIRADASASSDGVVADATPQSADTLAATSAFDALVSAVSDGGVVLADATTGTTRDAMAAVRDGGLVDARDGSRVDGAATTTKPSGGCGCVVGGGNTSPAGFWPLLALGFLALWRGARRCRSRG